MTYTHIDQWVGIRSGCYRVYEHIDLWVGIRSGCDRVYYLSVSAYICKFVCWPVFNQETQGGHFHEGCRRSASASSME